VLGKPARVLGHGMDFAIAVGERLQRAVETQTPP
jgi:hypothetical protein